MVNFYLKIQIFINRIYLCGLLILNYRENKRGGVLYILPWLGIGGSDKVALDTFSGLASKGIKLHCITTMPSSNEWLFKAEDYCVSTIDLGKVALESNKAWFIKQYVKVYRIRTIITSNNIAGYEAAKIIKEYRTSIRIIDVLHGQGGSHEGGGWPYFSYQYRKYLDLRIVVTEYLKNYMVANKYAEPQFIKVIHNGIDTNVFNKSPKPAVEINKNRDKFIILWAGRFSLEKHPEIVIKIAQSIAKTKQRSLVHFILAGSGNMKDELIEMVNKYKLNDLVTITSKPYSNASTYMSYADLLLVTSEMEGLPIVILEAFSSKLPVIASDVGGISEIVNNGINGYLVKYGSSFAKKTADKIIFLQQHKNLLLEMRESCYETVKEDFSIEKMVDSYIKALLTY